MIKTIYCSETKSNDILIIANLVIYHLKQLDLFVICN